MSLKLLGIQIANGYSSEAHVAAGLLGCRGRSYDAHILHHVWPEDRHSAAEFADQARVSVTPFDTGWRPNKANQRKPTAKMASHLRFRSVLPKMLKAARQACPDVIYSSQQHWDCFAASYIARRLNKPQIIHLHYTVGDWLRQPVLARLLTVDHVVAISEFIRAEALRHGVPPERVTTIRNFLIPFADSAPGTREAVRGELGIPQDAPTIGIVARLDEGKGQDDTIRAFAQVAALFPEARLVIVGDGIQRQALETQAAQTGFGRRILFTGRRSDVPRVLAALDVFAHPSRNEPFGLALAEASAAGLPVVAYAEGGTVEVVCHGSTGLLAAPGDCTELARYLTELLTDPRKAQALGRAGRQKMQDEFRPEDAARAFSALLQQKKECASC